jgi:hypothetical protein
LYETLNFIHWWIGTVSLNQNLRYFIEDGSMTHLRLRNENFSEHFEVTTQADSPSDSPINHALIAMAQEVAELLKQAYPVQVGQIDRVELIDGKRSPQ